MSTKMIKKAVLITKEQNQKLNNLIPWGDFSELMRMILDDFISIMSDPEQAQKIMYLYKMKKLYLDNVIKLENSNDTVRNDTDISVS